MTHKKILIADDKVGLSDLLGRIVSLAVKEQYQLYLAPDGADAWEIYRKEKPIDLVLTDLRMPKMNGYELINNIVELESGFSLDYWLNKVDIPEVSDKIIAITGNCPEYMKNNLEQIGIELMKKPFELNKIISSIQYILG